MLHGARSATRSDRFCSPRVRPVLNVVAVVVTRNPGPWFEDALASLATQDHPNLSILVLDDGSLEPVTARVAAVVPSAFVRRHDNVIGFGAAANQVLEMVQGASYYLFCHDDVALAPDAVRLLVSEAEASGFDLLGPKIVTWNDHERLVSVGLGVDRAGSSIALVEPFELDQGQHDAVREVTALPDAVLLVRATAFAALDGFDATLTAPQPGLSADPATIEADARTVAASGGPDVGEDIDLSWRARQQRLRLGVQPAARAAHAGEWHGRGTVLPNTPNTQGSAMHPADADSFDSARAVVLRTRERNRIRSMLTTASGVRVPFVLPLLLVQSIWRSRHRSRSAVPGGVGGVDSRRASAAGWRAWREVFRGLSATRNQRRRVQRHRVVGERELLRPLPPVASRAGAAFRADVTADGARVWNMAERTVSNDSLPARIVAVAAFIGAFVLLVGSRRIVFGRLPAVGQFAPLPSVRTLWGLALGGWRDVGVGLTAPAPPALWLLSILGTAFLGATGLLRTVLAVGMLPIGLAGMWQLAGATARLGSRDESTRGPGRHGNAVRVAQVTATFAYGVIPLGYDAIGRGRLDGCIAIGLTPWLVRGLLRAIEAEGHSDQRNASDRRAVHASQAEAARGDAGRSDTVPFAAPEGPAGATEPTRTGFDRRAALRRAAEVSSDSVARAALRPRAGRQTRSRVVGALRFGVPLAIAAALAPGLLIGVLLAGIGLVLGSALLGQFGEVRAFMLRLISGYVAALALLAPWSADLLRSGSHAALLTGGDQAVTLRASIADLLRLHLGPVGATPFGWLLLVAALFPLFVADGARFRGAVRAWAMVLVSVAAVWLAGRGWLGLAMANPFVALAPAGVGIALASGLGIAGFVADARARRFGWRQVFAALSLFTIAAAALPIVAASLGGRWNLPERDAGQALGWLPDQATAGPFRTLWIGSPSVLPAASWRISPDLAFTLSDDGLPDATDQWGSRRTAGVDDIATGLDRVLQGRTNRHGADLADWGVRYVVLVSRAAPRAPAHPLSVDVRRGFDDQLDLRQIESEVGLTVYENTAWSPIRLVVPVLVDSGIRSGTLSPTDLLRSQAAFLGPRHGRSFKALISADSALVFRSSFDSQWELNLGGRTVAPLPLDSGGMAYVPSAPAVGTGGSGSGASADSIVPATIVYRNGLVHWVVVAMQVLLWIAALAVLVIARASRHTSSESRLVAEERIAAALEVDSQDDDRFGDPFRTSFDHDETRVFGLDADFDRPPDTDDGFAVFDTPIRVADRSARRAPRPSRAQGVAGRSLGSRGPSAPTGAAGGIDVAGAADVADTAARTSGDTAARTSGERNELPEDGSLADEMWERWMRRRGGERPKDDDRA